MRDKKKQFYLITAEENTIVDLKHLRKELGAYRCLTFATDAELDELLYLKPGEVSPFALLNCEKQPNVKFILDIQLEGLSHLNFHPLDATSTTTISFEGLQKFVLSCGHSLSLMNLSPQNPSSSSSSSSFLNTNPTESNESVNDPTQ